MSGETNEAIEVDLDAEIAQLSAAISSYPRDAAAYRKRGLLKARARRYDEALQDFEQTLRLAPDDGHAYGLRALVWAKKGDRVRALHDFDEAIRLAPRDADLLRTHRDRVLSEKLGGPIAGGDFDLLKNSFVLLGLPPTAKPAAIKEAYEDAIEDEIDDADRLTRAQQTLLTPRLRIEAEVSGFLDVDPSVAKKIISGIRTGMPIADIKEWLAPLHSLPRSNVIAHYGSAQPLGFDSLCDLIKAQAAVAPGAVCDAINDVRQEIALGRVDRESVSDALAKLQDRQIKAVIETLGFEDDAVALFDRFVSEIAAGADSSTILRLDIYVSMFRQTVAAELSKRGEAVFSACEEIRKNPQSDAAYDNLEKTLNFWIALVRPVQTYETNRQREDTTAREMYGKIRELALHLANEQFEFESATKVVAIASNIFAHLPRAADQIADDTKRLLELHDEKQADQHLALLLVACTRANDLHQEIESELLKAGFGPGSIGSMKFIFDQFEAAVISTANLTISDAPWRLVRSIAISLNNDSSSPQAAEKIIQGLLDYAAQRSPTPEMIAILRDDQRAFQKGRLESRLIRNLEAQKWKEVEQQAEAILALETDEEHRRTVRNVRDAAVAKRKARTRVRSFWGVVIVGGAIWALLANGGDHSPQTAQYRSQQSFSNTPARPQTTSSPQQRSSSVDTSEIMPVVGTGQELNRANIRYCTFQRVRIEAARTLINSDLQVQRFNAVIDDYNSRCSNYRYLRSDKDAVDGELRDKRYLLESQARALAASWRSPSP